MVRVIIASVIMASVTYGKWLMASVTYGKCIMTNVIRAKIFMAKYYGKWNWAHDNQREEMTKSQRKNNVNR